MNSDNQELNTSTSMDFFGFFRRKSPSDLWKVPSHTNNNAKSEPMPMIGNFYHQRSHSDTICSVPDEILESLLGSSSVDYWSNLRERMEQDKKDQQEKDAVTLVQELHEKYNSEQGLFAQGQSTVFMNVKVRIACSFGYNFLT